MRVPRLALAAGGTVALLVLGLFDPSVSAFFPKCPFLLLTGLQCPGCGTQRALHQLLHLRLREALEYNAMMVAALPLLAFLIIADLLRKRCPGLYRASVSPVLSWSVLAAVLLWWVLRNLFYCSWL